MPITTTAAAAIRIQIKIGVSSPVLTDGVELLSPPPGIGVGVEPKYGVEPVGVGVVVSETVLVIVSAPRLLS